MRPRRLALPFAATSFLGVVSSLAASAAGPVRTGVVCVQRQRTFPAEDGLPDPPFPRGVYFLRIDDRAPVEMRPDRGTLVEGLDLSVPHRVTLLARSTPLATTRVHLDGPAPVCVGMQEPNAIGVWPWRSKKACGCIEPTPPR